MYRTMMKTKLHRATVTEAKLNYVGSITIDEELMELGDILQDEKVQVVNLNNGARWVTYAIKGPRHSGIICLNGGGARLAQPGDIVIIISYATMTDDEAKQFHPKVLFLDANNKVAINGLNELHAVDAEKLI